MGGGGRRLSQARGRNSGGQGGGTTSEAGDRAIVRAERVDLSIYTSDPVAALERALKLAEVFMDEIYATGYATSGSSSQGWSG